MSDLIEQGGFTANYTGNRLQNFVEHTLVEKGYTFIDKKKFIPATYLEQPIYSKQFFLGQSIYGTNSYCDFILYHPEKYKDCLVVECKWQQSGGSVDEKYPYLIMNIQMKYPHKAILLLDGGGYKKTAKAWIKSQIGNNLINVFDMTEFQKWANQGHI
jgi:site-specific DNA-adenine methylase